MSIASSNANGASMSYSYDSLNRLSSVTDRLGTSNYTYDGASNVSTVTYLNGVQTNYQQYDAMNRILQMATQNSGYIYQRGPTGNLTSVTEQNGARGAVELRRLNAPSSRRARNGIACHAAIDHAPDSQWIAVFQLVGEREVGEVLETDGADKAIDGERANRGGAAIAGGGVGAAVHHGVTDFDAGGEAVDDEPSGFALESGNEIGGIREVGLGAVQSGGKLALKRTQEGKQILAIFIANDQRGRPKNLGEQFGMALEIAAVGLQHRGDGVCGPTICGGDGLGHSFDGAQPAALLHSRAVAVRNSLGQHGRDCGRLDELFKLGDEFVSVSVARQEDEPRLGAELADPKGERREEAAGDLGSARAQSFRKHNDGIDAAHLHEAGDGFGAARSAVHEGLSRGERAGESDALDVGMLDQRAAELAAGSKEQGEDPGRQTTLADGMADDLADELARAGMRGMGFDDDGIAAGERGGGVAAGDRKGERKIAGAEYGDGAQRAKHGADVGPGQRLAIGLRGIDARVDPGAVFNKLREKTKLIDSASQLAFEARFRQSRFPIGARDHLRSGGIKASSDVAQEMRLFAARQLAINRERLFGQIGGEVHVFERGVVKGRIERRTS